jgi:hypothetical protein
VERRGWVIRTGTIMGQLETGGARRFRWRAAALRDGTSRVMGDCQARICEELGVKFLGPTRRACNGIAANHPQFLRNINLSFYEYNARSDCVLGSSYEGCGEASLRADLRR